MLDNQTIERAQQRRFGFGTTRVEVFEQQSGGFERRQRLAPRLAAQPPKTRRVARI